MTRGLTNEDLKKLEAQRKGEESQEEEITEEPKQNKQGDRSFRDGSRGTCVNCRQTHIKDQLQ